MTAAKTAPKERKPRTKIDPSPKGLVKTITAHLDYLDTFDIPDTSKLKHDRAQFVKLKGDKDKDTQKFIDGKIAEIDAQLAAVNSDLGDNVNTVKDALDNLVNVLKTVKGRGLTYYATARK